MIEIPGYTLRRQIGQGGMAVVYLAVQESLGREVALKILSATLAEDAQARERFVREARTAANLHHLHIVPIYDVGTHEGVAYIAMEFEPGGTASPVVGAPREAHVALGIVRQIALALDYAHGQGVVHRDIKPENILCRVDGTCMLSDFGIARVIESTTVLTREGTCVGTPQYMSPEQLRGEKVDGRADLYSLGVVLYQLLTGALPYDGSDGWAIGLQHLNADIPRLPASHANLQPLLDGLMAKQPKDRPQTGAALVQQIDTLLTGSVPAISVPRPAPPGTRRRLASWKWLLGPVIAALAIAAIALWEFRPGLLSAVTATTQPAPLTANAKSIAVLPFVNMSSDKENEYFADGISEEILNQLAQLKNLRVAGRTSSFSFKGQNQDLRLIAEKLGVAYVLEGSVRKSATNVRITAQLIQAKDGFQVWAETYDRELTDIFKVQDEISRAVLDAMKVNLLGERPLHVATTSIAAYNLHLQAQANLFKRGADNMKLARKQFEAALALDPDYVPSLVGLARTLAFLPSYEVLSGEATEQLAAASVQAAQRALELDPDNAGAYSLLGVIQSIFEWQWIEGGKLIERSLELAPNDADIVNMAGDYYMTIRDPVRGIATEAHALELNPLSPVNNWELGHAYASIGDFENALVHLNAGHSLAPEIFRPYFALVWSYGALKRFDEMHAVIANARRLTHEPEVRYLGLEVWAAIAEGRREAGLQLLARVEPYAKKEEINRAYVGYCYLMLGDSDKAAFWLQEAARVDDRRLTFPVPLDLWRIDADPKARVIFRDPRLSELLAIRTSHARAAGEAR